MTNLHTIARRVADRIERERAAGDDWQAERILTAECEAAGVNGEELRQQIAALAAQFIGLNVPQPTGAAA